MEFQLEEGRIFSLNEKQELIAQATYLRQETVINVDHVYVNPDYRGQKIAEQVMLAMVDFLRKNQWKATATCTYAQAWFAKHQEEYADVLLK